MKRFRLTCYFLCLMLVFMALPLHAQQTSEDLAGIYKNYFKLLIDQDYAKAWDGLAEESRLILAGLISKEVKAPSAEVLKRLNNNQNGLRDKYFSTFQESISELLEEIYSTGKYSVKSKGSSTAIITVEVQEEPKDFGMVKEEGQWKVNFFKDLMKE